MIKEYLELKKRQSQLKSIPQINQNDHLQSQILKSYSQISKWNVALNQLKEWRDTDKKRVKDTDIAMTNGPQS